MSGLEPYIRYLTFHRYMREEIYPKNWSEVGFFGADLSAGESE